MASRKEIYEKLESIEGGESIKDSLKELFQADDKKLQDSEDSLKAVKGDLSTLRDEFDGLKSASADTVPKTQLEQVVAEMKKELGVISKERDEEKQLRIKEQELNEKNEVEKKQAALEKHFFDSISEPFGAVGASDAVKVSKDKMAYTDEGDMSYSGKVGDEALELFRTDNARFMPNRGTSTTGGNSEQNDTSYIDSLREQMLRD